MIEDLLRQIRRLERRVADLERVEGGGAWSDWLPTLTQSGSVSVSVAYARYTTIKRSVILQARLTITSAGTAGNSIVVGGIPAVIAPVTYGNQADARGVFTFLDNGNTWYTGSVYPVSASKLAFMSYGNGNLFGITPNFAVANNDRLGISVVWER